LQKLLLFGQSFGCRRIDQSMEQQFEKDGRKPPPSSSAAFAGLIGFSAFRRRESGLLSVPASAEPAGELCPRANEAAAVVARGVARRLGGIVPYALKIGNPFTPPDWLGGAGTKPAWFLGSEGRGYGSPKPEVASNGGP
jgi:hypothetical protein